MWEFLNLIKFISFRKSWKVFSQALFRRLMEEILFFALESRCRSGNSDRCCTTSPVIGPGSGFRDKNHLRDFVIACQGKGVNQSEEKNPVSEIMENDHEGF